MFYKTGSSRWAHIFAACRRNCDTAGSFWKYQKPAHVGLTVAPVFTLNNLISICFRSLFLIKVLKWCDVFDCCCFVFSDDEVDCLFLSDKCLSKLKNPWMNQGPPPCTRLKKDTAPGLLSEARKIWTLAVPWSGPAQASGPWSTLSTQPKAPLSSTRI